MFERILKRLGILPAPLFFVAGCILLFVNMPNYATHEAKMMRVAICLIGFAFGMIAQAIRDEGWGGLASPPRKDRATWDSR